MKKRIFTLILALSLAIPHTLAFAYELPSAFWGLNNSYSSAKDSSNYKGIAEYGSQVIDLISKEPKNEQTKNIIGSRAYDVAFAYYFLGDYENATKYFDLYIPYGKELGWTDGAKIATEFVKQLTSSFDIYKHTSVNQKKYGAKNEPDGVLYGQVSEKTQPDDSMILLYLEYGYENEFDWARVIFREAQSKGKAIELALNFPNQGDTARSVKFSDTYLDNLHNMISQYPDVPVYLRIGAEVNIWGNYCTPEEFKAAFNAIASKMNNLSNVATVWSIAHTDRWYSEAWPYTFDDFYPGDDLVDWVGVTIYSNKYFEGKLWDGVSQFNEVCFKTGYSSDPVLMIKDFVEAYGDRKPIMISECGAAYHTVGEMNQDHHDWAAEQVKKIYSFVPMVYPQVKLIAYFNKKITHEANWYDLDSSSALTASYNEIIKSPWFIQSSRNNKAEAFFEKVYNSISIDDSLTLSAYPHLYGADSITVDYYLDGQLAKSVNTVPYTVEFNNLKGKHSLKVVAKGSNGSSMEKSYTINSSVTAENINDFSDISDLNDFQRQSLEAVFNKKIITGYEDCTFKPYNTITRAEFATMICRMKGLFSDTPCTFKDASSHWASNNIMACVNKGIINGVGDNNFAPNNNITLEQALKIVTILADMAPSTGVYPDDFINAAHKNNLFDGLTSTDTKANLNRIDAAVILNKIM